MVDDINIGGNYKKPKGLAQDSEGWQKAAVESARGQSTPLMMM